ncbi:MAG: hypothetical protein AAGE01_17950 [Pseudomonadota bacterium]
MSMNPRDPREVADVMAYVRASTSNSTSVVVRAAFLTLAWMLVARAIDGFGVSLGYVVLPWVVQFLLIQWLGLTLAARVVDEPRFRETAGSVVGKLGWTIALSLPYVILLGWDSGFSLALLQERLPDALARVAESGIAAATATLALSTMFETMRDLRRWRTEQEPFIFRPSQRTAVRMILLVVLAIAVPIALHVMSQDPASSLPTFQEGWSYAWLAFGILVAMDALIVLFGGRVRDHFRSVVDKQAARMTRAGGQPF